MTRTLLCHLFIGVASCAAIAIGGCAHIDNDRLSVSNLQDLDEPGGARFDTSLPYHPTETFGRHNWSPMTYTVANDTTIHGPTYAPLRDPLEATERQRAAHPTLDGAFDFTGQSESAQIRQGFTEPIITLVDAILIIPRAIIVSPLAEVESPAKSYQRDSEVTPYRPAIRQVARAVEAEPAPEPASNPNGREGEESGDTGRVGLK